jgi:hypothetical protein
LVILLVGRWSPLGVRAQRGSLTGDLGWPVRVGEERKKGEDGAAGKWGQGARERRRESGRVGGERSGADMRARVAARGRERRARSAGLRWG